MVTTTTAGVLLWRIVVAGAILLGGVAAGSWLSGAVGLTLERSGLDPAVRRGLARAVRPIVILVAVVAALEYLDLDLTIVAAMVGAATLAIGLALRGTLSNAASGGVLLTLRPFREGDWIGCAGEHGRVLEQGTLAVVLERSDGVVVTVPNDVVFGGPIHNHSRRGSRRIDVRVALPLDVDLAELRARLLAITEIEPRIAPSPGPVVRVGGVERDTLHVVVEAWALPSSFSSHEDVSAAFAEAVHAVVSGLGTPSRTAIRGSAS